MVTEAELCHAGAEPAHDAGSLVAEDGRQIASPVPVHVGDVAVTDRAGGDLDPDLAGARRCELDVLDLERPPELAADGRPHGLIVPPGRERRLPTRLRGGPVGPAVPPDDRGCSAMPDRAHERTFSACPTM